MNGNDEEETVNIGAAAAQARTQSETKVLPDADAAAAEAQRQADDARIRQEEREARQKALGTVPATEDDVTLPPPERPYNDKFLGSIGLFLLRLALAAILGVRGVQVLFDIDSTTNWLTDYRVPQPGIVAWALGLVLVVIAAMLLIGFGVRLSAILTAALGIALLVFVRWGYDPVFVKGQAGFVGDWDVLVAAAGLTLVFLGSGGWAIDAAMRYDRARRKQYQ